MLNKAEIQCAPPRPLEGRGSAEALLRWTSLQEVARQSGLEAGLRSDKPCRQTLVPPGNGVILLVYPCLSARWATRTFTKAKNKDFLYPGQQPSFIPPFQLQLHCSGSQSLYLESKSCGHIFKQEGKQKGLPDRDLCLLSKRLAT